MQKAIILFSLLIFVLDISSAEIAWQYEASAGITVKPVLSSNIVFISSQNGVLHAVSLANGRAVWKKPLGGYLLQPVLFQNGILIANNTGTVTKIRRDGTTELQINITQGSNKATTIFGIEVSQNRAYIATDTGIFMLEGNNLSVFFNSSDAKAYTAPAVSGSTVIFGAGDELISVNANRQVNWRTKVARLWISKPTVEGSIVYIGALDNAVYAIDLPNGKIRWRYETEGWVAGTPLIQNNVLYVGSDDGYLYAINQYSGGLLWKAKTGQAIQTTPIAGNFGGRGVLFVGSTDGKLYAIDRDNGMIFWRFSAGDWVASPATANKQIIVGSRNGILYSIKTERGCTINEPQERSTVSQKEIKIKGTVLSSTGIPGASIRINDGGWKATQKTGDSWETSVDPAEMRAGPNRVYCLTRDADGEEDESYYSMLLIKATNIPKSKLIITAPGTAVINSQVTIAVNDGDDNSPVEDFKIRYDGTEQVAAGNITLNMTKEGRFNAIITKTGFEDAAIEIEVKAPNALADIALPAAGGLIVLALLYFIILRKILKR